MSKLFIVEPNKTDSDHLSFNAAMLGALAPALREHSRGLFVFASQTHRDRLQASLPEDTSITWLNIPVVTGLSRSFVKKFAVEVLVLFAVLLKARRRGADVLLLSVFPNALACVLLFKWLFRKVRLHVILHGELESLIIPEKQRIYKEGFWVKLALVRLFDGKWPTLYVLGQGLKRRLLETFPEHAQLEHLRVIEHPYVFSGNRPTPIARSGPLRVGYVGVGRLKKGIDAFFRLANGLSDCISAGTLEFVVVGGIEPGAVKSIPPGVRVLSERPASLSGEEFARGIAELDCAVFLYNQNYAFTASGAVFDVLNKGVEILALENHYLRDLARDDSEGGMTFFGSIHDVEQEIRARLSAGRRPERHTYSQIKWRHWSAVQAGIAANILGFPPIHSSFRPSSS